MPHIPGHISPFREAGLLGGPTAGRPPGEVTPEVAAPGDEFGQYKSAGEERRAFLKYLADRRGGLFRLMAKTGATDYTENSFYAEWVRSGRSETYTPMAVRPISAEDVARLGEKGITPEMLAAAGIPTAGPPTPQEQITTQLEAATAAEEGLGLITPTDTPGAPGAPTPTGLEIEPETGREGFWGPDGWFWSADELGELQRINFDASKVVQPEAQPLPGETEAQRLQREQQQAQFETTQQRLTGQTEADRLFREQQLEFQTETRRLEQERFQQGLTAQREERLAQLAAQPISWLQHAALSGQTPVVQPWMIPLMRPGQNLQVGQPIPGFQAGAPGAAQQGGFLPGTATPAPAGNQFANLPELRRPSAQLFARMGPTAQAQWLGLRQARTGIPPQETLFRQTQGGPPGSARGGFQQQRLRV